MSRNALHLIITLLVVGGGVMGYQLYAEPQKTDRVEIDVGKNGVSIQKN
jgi:hypothetical protein